MQQRCSISLVDVQRQQRAARRTGTMQHYLNIQQELVKHAALLLQLAPTADRTRHLATGRTLQQHATLTVADIVVLLYHQLDTVPASHQAFNKVHTQQQTTANLGAHLS
jgi:hypothetical protein